MRPRGVMLVVDGYPGPGDPANSVFFHDQARALARRMPVGVAQALTCSPRQWLARGAAMPRDAANELDGIPVYRMESFVGTTRISDWLVGARVRSLGRAVRRFRERCGPVGVLHAHCSAFAGETAVRVGRSLGVPVVITEHYSFLPELIEHYGRRLLDAYEEADAVLAVSNSLADRMKCLGVTCPIRVVPNAVDTEVFTGSPTATPADGEWNLLSVASDRPVKDLPSLLSAVAALPAVYRWTLAIVGGGEYREARQLCETLGIAGRVAFVGPLDRPALAARMNDSHLVVSSSRIETFGLSLAEALCVGRPVVATDSGGPRDVVGPGDGRLVPVGDASALAAAIAATLDAFSNYDLPAISRRARARFGFDAFADRMIEIYGQLGCDRAGASCREKELQDCPSLVSA